MVVLPVIDHHQKESTCAKGGKFASSFLGWEILGTTRLGGGWPNNLHETNIFAPENRRFEILHRLQRAYPFSRGRGYSFSFFAGWAMSNLCTQSLFIYMFSTNTTDEISCPWLPVTLGSVFCFLFTCCDVAIFRPGCKWSRHSNRSQMMACNLVSLVVGWPFGHQLCQFDPFVGESNATNVWLTKMRDLVFGVGIFFDPE